MQWFGDYLVNMRMIPQDNLLNLFVRMLDQIGSPVLFANVLQSAIQASREMVAGGTDQSFRKKLKTLGELLGLVTLGRGRPLLRSQLDIRELLLQAYENGRLISCVAFVCRILQGAMQGPKSRVFLPPNPWMMNILGLLREIYSLEHLKFNIKFELSSVLDAEIDFQKFHPTSLLCKRR